MRIVVFLAVLDPSDLLVPAGSGLGPRLDHSRVCRADGGRAPGPRRLCAVLILGWETMSTLEQWTAAVRADLGLGSDPLGTEDTKAVLDLARDVAHGVDRPAAPLTAYLVGMAVGRGLMLPDASERVCTLAARWAGSNDPAGGQEGP